ncbi:unnamed protein product [Calypogeia fissa]
MRNYDVDPPDQHLEKSPLFLKKSIPGPFGSSKWVSDIHKTSTPHSLFHVISSEQFEKSWLVAMQEAALHDSMVLEMGYQMTDSDSSTVILDGDLLKGPHVGPTLGRYPLEDGKDHKALKTICLRELKVGKVHRGKILNGTLCCKTVKTSAIMNIFEEDDTRDATRLVISNPMHKSLTTAKSQLLYPKGSKVSVQDPYLKRFADGMVGLLVENPTDINFTFLPKELPPDEKKRRKVTLKELAAKFESPNVTNDEQETHANFTRCVGPCQWGSVQVEQSALDKAHPECHRKILAKEHIDLDLDSKSSSSGPNASEESLSTQEGTSSIGAKVQTKVVKLTDKHNFKIEEQDVLESPADFDKSLQSHSACEEEKSLHQVCENSSNNENLLGCVHNKVIFPQKLSDEFELGRQSEHSSEGQETNFLRNAEAEQEKINPAQKPLQEINQVTCAGNIMDNIDLSVDCTEKILVDETLEKNTLSQGGGDCTPEICESSHGNSTEGTRNEILSTKTGGDHTSPSGTSTEKSSRTTFQINDADNIIADNHLSPVALRLLGNKHFAQQNWAKAIDLYTQATFKAIQDSVQESKENFSPNHERIVNSGEPQKDTTPQKEEQGNEVVMDYSNRAEAWLRLHQYERAWADAERALSFDPTHLKSLFRKGRALLGLGDYRQALAHFEAANARTPFNKDVLAAIKLSRTADQQNHLGIYDLTDYYLRGRFNGEIPNCADYIGPIQIRAHIGEKGRGLFLTKSVEAGDLLMVSNPLAFCQPEQQSHSNSKLHVLSKEFMTQEDNGRIPVEVEDKLVEILLERAKVSSKHCERLLTLCHCKQGISHQPAPPVDLFISGRQISPPSDMEHIDTEELDDIRLRQIIAQNVIDGNMVSTTSARRHVFHHEEIHDGISSTHFYGLWVLPSFINHSCVPNVSMVIIGKCIFVYASKDMHVGEELQCSYYNVFQPLPQRRELASRYWSFSCRCARCLVESKFDSSLGNLYSLHTQVQPSPTLVMRYSSPSRNRILAKDIAKELQVLGFLEKVGSRELSWLQASFTQLYITSQDIIGAHESCSQLDTALCAMEMVSPSSSSTLEVGLLCRENVERDCNGKKTSTYKFVNRQLLRICKCIFGKHRTTVLQSLVEGFPANVTRKV